MKRQIKYTIAALCSVLCLAGCAQRHSDEHEHDGHDHNGEIGHNHHHDGEADHEEHSHEGHNHGDGTIEFSRQQAEAAGLETETVVPGRFSGIIRTSGEILPATGDEQTIAATTSGIVSFSNGLTSKSGQARLVPGARVQSGSTLMWISAKNMSEGDPAVKAKAAFDAAQKEYNRASSLIESGAISRKAFEQAELAYETARAEYEAYKGRVSESGVAVRSSLTGYLKQLLVDDGAYVSAGEPLATVTMNRTLQLRADVPQKYFSRLKTLVGANFRPSYSSVTYSVKDLGGRLVSTGRSTAADSYYIPVIFEFPNTGDFLPGAFADIYLIDGESDGVISVPESAITEEQGVHFVYLKICEEDYKKQEVTVGRTDGFRREILSGLKEGDNVVTRGAFQVKLASVSGTVPEGHSHNH